ncbi:MAG: glycine cleavage system protein H [Planctomycetota bacterium]
MGEFNASFRGDRLYATNHMWALPFDDQSIRFGLTEYAVRLLQDVYFLDWVVEPSASVEDRAMIGSIESKKAESDLFAPLAGTLKSINDLALDDPSLINADPYGEGWLIQIEAATDQASKLLTPQQYAEHLVEAWDVAQRTIKGQANT